MSSNGLFKVPDSKFIEVAQEYFHDCKFEAIPGKVRNRVKNIVSQCERCRGWKYKGKKLGVHQCLCPDWDELNALPNRPKPMLKTPHCIAPNEMALRIPKITYGERLAVGFAWMKGLWVRCP